MFINKETSMRHSSERYLQFIKKNTEAFDDLPSIEQLKQRCFLFKPGKEGSKEGYSFDERSRLLLRYNGRPFLSYCKMMTLQPQASKHIDQILLWEMQPICGSFHCLNISHWKFQEDSPFTMQKLLDRFISSMFKEEQELEWPLEGKNSILRYQNRVKFMLTTLTGEGCWRPNSGINKAGQSKMSLQGKQYTMSQAAYMLFRHSSEVEKGNISWDMVYNPDKNIYHTCHHTWCCNPDHMTQEDVLRVETKKNKKTAITKTRIITTKRHAGRPLTENLTLIGITQILGRESIEDIFELINKVKGLSPIEVLEKYKISLTTYEFLAKNIDKFKEYFHRLDNKEILDGHQ